MINPRNRPAAPIGSYREVPFGDHLYRGQSEEGEYHMLLAGMDRTLASFALLLDRLELPWNFADGLLTIDSQVGPLAIHQRRPEEAPGGMPGQGGAEAGPRCEAAPDLAPYSMSFSVQSGLVETDDTSRGVLEIDNLDGYQLRCDIPEIQARLAWDELGRGDIFAAQQGESPGEGLIHGLGMAPGQGMDADANPAGMRQLWLECCAASYAVATPAFAATHKTEALAHLHGITTIHLGGLIRRGWDHEQVSAELGEPLDILNKPRADGSPRWIRLYRLDQVLSAEFAMGARFCGDQVPGQQDRR